MAGRRIVLLHLISCLLVHGTATAAGRSAARPSPGLLPRTLRKNVDPQSLGITFPNNTYLDRSFFPPGFIFGALTLAVKHEGATVGKVDSIWDAYAPKNGVVVDGVLPGNVGDEYNRYAEDIDYIDAMGMDAFRFSLPWTRILPDRSGTPDAEAIAHYNDLINILTSKGIEPHVTLWTEDHPQALEEEYGGLLSTQFIDDFVAFANVCFAAFGDRVKHWVTLDEPNDYVGLAYASSQSPPGRCTPGFDLHGNCSQGNSSTEPYLVAHNLLLAHSAVAKLYKSTYQATQGGYIGIALWLKWYEPLNTTNPLDVAASKRAQDFFFGWFMDPLATGEYPENMRTIVGSRLPSFTKEEAADLRASWDFIGINALTANYVTYVDSLQEVFGGYFEEMKIETSAYRDGVPIGLPAQGSIRGDAENEFMVSWCLERIVNYMKDTYGNPPMFITETGWGMNYLPSLDENLNDTERVQCYFSYYSSLSKAISNGANVKGVFAMSLIDGFEYIVGLTVRFGLFHVDEDMARYPRLSAFWHQQLLTMDSSSSDSSSSTMLFTTNANEHEESPLIHIA